MTLKIQSHIFFTNRHGNESACFFSCRTFDGHKGHFGEVVVSGELEARNFLHGGERLLVESGPCKIFFAFFREKITAHFLLCA